MEVNMKQTTALLVIMILLLPSVSCPVQAQEIIPAREDTIYGRG
jgi:hypothetical protein